MPGIRLEFASRGHKLFNGELRGRLHPIEGSQSTARLSFTYSMDSCEKLLRRHQRHTYHFFQYMTCVSIRGNVLELLCMFSYSPMGTWAGNGPIGMIASMLRRGEKKQIFLQLTHCRICGVSLPAGSLKRRAYHAMARGHA